MHNMSQLYARHLSLEVMIQNTQNTNDEPAGLVWLMKKLTIWTNETPNAVPSVQSQTQEPATCGKHACGNGNPS